MKLKGKLQFTIILNVKTTYIYNQLFQNGQLDSPLNQQSELCSKLKTTNNKNNNNNNLLFKSLKHNKPRAPGGGGGTAFDCLESADW